jgi:phosphoribosylglycinamide formyltransferase-1
VLTQQPVPVLPDDDEARLHERIKTVERELLVRTVAALATGSPLPAPTLPAPTLPAPTRSTPTEESTR